MVPARPDTSSTSVMLQPADSTPTRRESQGSPDFLTAGWRPVLLLDKAVAAESGFRRMALAGSDLVLSEVHMGEVRDAGGVESGGTSVVMLLNPASPAEAGEDDEPPRRPRLRASRLCFEHRGLTTVDDVAFQLWRGAFLLAEYVVACRDMWRGRTVVELGAGVGLVSTVLGRYSKSVFCTDLVPAAVSLAARNVARNSAWICNEGSVKCRVLDWTTGWPPQAVKESGAAGAVAPEPGLWTLEDIAEAASAEFFFGSDLVYDPPAVRALFSLIGKLLPLRGLRDEAASHVLKAAGASTANPLPAPRFFLAIEKRFNFEASSCSVRPYGYATFETQMCQDAWHWDLGAGILQTGQDRGPNTGDRSVCVSAPMTMPRSCPSCDAGHSYSRATIVADASCHDLPGSLDALEPSSAPGDGGRGACHTLPLSFAGRRVPSESFSSAVQHPSYDRASPALELWEIARI